MSEYIITDEQLKTAAEAYSEHELSLPITGVFISGDKLPEIVRCRDCYYADEFEGGYWCASGDMPFAHVTPNGFCAWGERRQA